MVWWEFEVRSFSRYYRSERRPPHFLDGAEEWVVNEGSFGWGIWGVKAARKEGGFAILVRGW